jgi:hypothetical protein
MNLERINKQQQQQRQKRIQESQHSKRGQEPKRARMEQLPTIGENTLLLEQLSTDFDTLTGSNQDFQRIYNEASEKLKKEHWIEQVPIHINIGMSRM